MKNSKKPGKKSEKQNSETKSGLPHNDDTPKYSTKKLKILGATITVKYLPEVKDEDGVCIFGRTRWEGESVTVEIALGHNGKPYSDEAIKRTLIHELFHISLSLLYYEAENRDEHLVEWLASCFYTFRKHKLI